MFKVSNKASGVFIVNFEHISHFVLVFQLLTLNMQLPTGQSFISSKQTPLYCGDVTKTRAYFLYFLFPLMIYYDLFN